MNKKRRNELTLLKYKKRLKNKFEARYYNLIDKEGNEIKYPSVHEMFINREQFKLKHTSTLCSCEGCSGYYKYKRHKKKQEDRKLILENKSENI